MRERGTVSATPPASREAISPRALSKLIGSIYDCALDPDLWERTLIDIAGALDCENATLHLNDLRHDRILISKTVGMEPFWVERILRHTPEINDLLTTYGLAVCHRWRAACVHPPSARGLH
jgi:hypothetical protein